MPSDPKPKTFVAAVSFRYGNSRYLAGELVQDRRVIDRLVRYGERFIKVKRSKTPAVDTATTDQSTKED
jgi:hypothetical protein